MGTSDSTTRPRRLPSNSTTTKTFLSGSRYRSWLQGDHLLHVRTEGYAERCKRFHLGEIEALVLTRTTAFRWITLVLLGLLILLGMTFSGIWAVSDWPLASMITGPLAALVVLLLALHLLMGPTCALHLHTAVQVEVLYACQRMRTARRLLAILLPEIERRQGKLPEGTTGTAGTAETAGTGGK
ncbi:MAG: hypothetical protein HYV26_22130, partial [Candidatus Hydrogenedentes bacterium]|nr:hypothetical protein [Candidatus Hydrogenedentota bacterium]